ncbi:MAG: cytochrome c [Cyclobacteriaceae bacterium]
MKTINTYSIAGMILLTVTLFNCGGAGENTDQKQPEVVVPTDPFADWQKNIGVGPIKSINLAAIDNTMAAEGQVIFEAKCTACHKTEKRFIGPAVKGVLDRRTAEWTMNMILNPDQMVQKDPMAKQLLIDFNGSPMANQNLSEDEARAVLEYFRTL